jgi:hypothetical protein
VVSGQWWLASSAYLPRLDLKLLLPRHLLRQPRLIRLQGRQFTLTLLLLLLLRSLTLRLLFLLFGIALGLRLRSGLRGSCGGIALLLPPRVCLLRDHCRRCCLLRLRLCLGRCRCIRRRFGRRRRFLR